MVKADLGFSHRKTDPPDLDESRTYYEEALVLWSENCYALGYYVELEIQESNEDEAAARLQTLCTTCNKDKRHEAVDAAIKEYDASSFTTPELDECSGAAMIR